MENSQRSSCWQAALITSGQTIVNLLLLYGLRQGVPRSYVINGVIGICYLIFGRNLAAPGIDGLWDLGPNFCILTA